MSLELVGYQSWFGGGRVKSGFHEIWKVIDWYCRPFLK